MLGSKDVRPRATHPVYCTHPRATLVVAGLHHVHKPSPQPIACAGIETTVSLELEQLSSHSRVGTSTSRAQEWHIS